MSRREGNNAMIFGPKSREQHREMLRDIYVMNNVDKKEAIG